MTASDLKVEIRQLRRELAAARMKLDSRLSLKQWMRILSPIASGIIVTLLCIILGHKMYNPTYVFDAMVVFFSVELYYRATHRQKRNISAQS